MKTSFNAEELALFETVLDRACVELQIVDEATRSLVAMRILHLAQEGECDPDRLLEYSKRVRSSAAA